MHVGQLPHLSAALRFKGRNGSGSCVQRSVALCLDLRGALLTFGTLRAANEEEAAVIANASREPFIHCWVEVDDTVFAPTTLEQTDFVLRPMRRSSYYELNGVRNVRYVPRQHFNALAKRYRLSSALRHDSQRFGSPEVTDAFLRAAGVRYRLSENRSLLPIGE